MDVQCAFGRKMTEKVTIAFPQKMLKEDWGGGNKVV